VAQASPLGLVSVSCPDQSYNRIPGVRRRCLFLPPPSQSDSTKDGHWPEISVQANNHKSAGVRRGSKEGDEVSRERWITMECVSNAQA